MYATEHAMLHAILDVVETSFKTHLMIIEFDRLLIAYNTFLF